MRSLIITIISVFMCAVLFCMPVYSSPNDLSPPDVRELYKQIQELKKKINQLEQKIRQKEVKEEKLRKDIEEVKEAKKTIEKIKERIGNISIHGGVVSYYQAASSGENSELGNPEGHFSNPDGGGYVADIELSWEPMENGEFYMRIHAGEGDGADNILPTEKEREKGARDPLFADLNTLNDDNPDDSEVDVLEAYYTQTLFDEMLSVSFGKTEPFAFVDDNEFANDENSQFVGKPFVNNPMFDSEDEYGPILALSFNPKFLKPLKDVTFTAVVQSSSYPRNEEGKQKDEWSNFFRRPLVAGQITYSPTIRGMSGNYRIYGWVQTYDHERIGNKTGTDEGWGVGISCDQYLTEKIGLFGRFGYQNDEVYEAPIFYSAGAYIKGLIPIRKDDELGIGLAGLKANHAFDDHHTEYHGEAYYKFVFSDNFALSLDLQYVENPLGNNDNNDIWAGMVRGEFSF